MTRIVWGMLWASLLGVEPQQAAPTESPKPAAPKVVLIEGERVRPEEAMVLTRSVLIEEGTAFRQMSELPENIATVRYNMNTYRIGYSLPAKKPEGRYAFDGPVKGWRAPTTEGVSMWPPPLYPVSRNEAMRRARSLEPIVLAQPIEEMKNLRVYYFPSLVGHNGERYTAQPMALAFFIHPNTGGRMTVMLRSGRTYGAVGNPLTSTTHIYVEQVASYTAGLLGLGTARVPKVFYSRDVQFGVQPFPKGDNFDHLMAKVLAAHGKPPLSISDSRALFHEMTRYIGGPVK